MFDLTLSFDNGPHTDVTPFVLDVLARRAIKTTFFVVGEKLARPGAREIARRAHAEGHWIGNHTFTHTVPLGERHDPEAPALEIGRTQALIGELAHPRRYFRPFGAGGNLDARLLSRAAVDYLEAGRFSCVLWNAIPRDFADPDGWVERALDQCRAQPWTLIVLHDLPNGAMRHLDLFLQSAADLGARLRQDFPPDCVPIVDGVVVRPLDGLVTR
jgi:peptidoglycan/xylan/chitin deacetylase (PgdA/CDA1 family)